MMKDVKFWTRENMEKYANGPISDENMHTTNPLHFTLHNLNRLRSPSPIFLYTDLCTDFFGLGDRNRYAHWPVETNFCTIPVS